MWVLLLITLVDGGAGQTKFEQRYYQTEQQCKAASQKFETASTYGYCNYKEPKP